MPDFETLLGFGLVGLAMSLSFWLVASAVALLWLYIWRRLC